MGYKDIKACKIQARALFMAGYSLFALSRRLGISRKTSSRWAIEEDWKKDRDKLIEGVKTSLDIDIQKEKERTLQLIRATESVYAKSIQEGTLEVTPQGLAILQKIKFDILEPKIVNNFVQNNQSNTVQFENQDKLIAYMKELREQDNAR